MTHSVRLSRLRHRDGACRQHRADLSNCAVVTASLTTSTVGVHSFGKPATAVRATVLASRDHYCSRVIELQAALFLSWIGSIRTMAAFGQPWHNH